jgi:dolichol-phosphate mannosyltransferase
MHIYKNLHLLEEGEKRGIAAAYMSGIRHAIDTLRAGAFIEFDGDGQHDPNDILRLVEKFDENFDYVIGSRYVKGGSVPHNWAWHRKFLSRFGSLYTRLLMEWPVKDVTSGFKLTRVSKFFPPKELLSRHYAYKIHLLSSMIENGARVAEVPITFRSREHDESKSTWRDIVESLRVTGVLRFQNLHQWRLVRVVAVGGAGMVIQTIFFEVFGIWSRILAPSTAAVIGAGIAILSNFFLNERYSFHDSIGSSSRYRRLIKFCLVSSGSIIIQWSCVFIAERFTESVIALNAVYLLSIALGFLVNYTGYYFFVWRKD